MKTTPRPYQLHDWKLTNSKETFAIFWEQGLGKSKLAIDTAFHLFSENKIKAVLVVAPELVHANFVWNEMPVHAWSEYDSLIYFTKKSKTKAFQRDQYFFLQPSKKLKVVAITYNSLKTDRGYEFAEEFLKKYPTLMILDESTAIGDPNNKQSKVVKDLGKLSTYRRIMTGTPVIESPFLAFNQMKFLDAGFWNKWGLSSYSVFKKYFGIFKKVELGIPGRPGNRSFEQVVGYRNMDKMQDIMKAHCVRRVKSEELKDLPDKVYSSFSFEMSEKQQDIYRRIKDEIQVSLDEGTLLPTMALTRVLRLQQVLSGFLPVVREGAILPGVAALARVADRVGLQIVKVVDPEQLTAEFEDQVIKVLGFHTMEEDTTTLADIEPPEENPRLQALKNLTDSRRGKMIIWARFTRDIDHICNLYAGQITRYDGQVAQADRKIALDRFRQDPEIRFFVANPQALSMGVTLTEASTVIYYSNLFSAEKRAQSEDRAHRIGQKETVRVIDLVARGTVDEKIMKALRQKYDISAKILGDEIKDWFR